MAGNASTGIEARAAVVSLTDGVMWEVPGVPGARLPANGAVASLGQGVHACLLYDDDHDPLPVIAPYVRAGLVAGEQCVYVVGDHDPQHVRQGLAAEGIDVASAEASGALVLVTHWEVSFPNGEFDPVAMIAYVRQTIEDAVDGGFAGLRVVAEMSWALQMGVGHDRLIQYEAHGDDLYPHEPLVAVCLYNRSRFPAVVWQDALRTHPVLVLGDQLYPNLYYEPPQAVIDGTTATARIDWMLTQLQRLHEAEIRRAVLQREHAARMEAEAAVRARDEFIAVAAHELRTPLAGTIGYIQLAKRHLTKQIGASSDGSVPAAQLAGPRRNIESAEQEGKRLERMISLLLDTTRLSTGSLTLSPETCDVAQLVAEAVDRARTIASQHRFVLRTPAGQFHADVDRLRIEQVLANILDNAVKYSPDGGDVEVDVSFGAVDTIQVQVRDYGLGVPVDDLERIFERYHRAHRDIGGTGLGLFVSRQIARLHGGDLSAELPNAEEHSGRGTRFILRLPHTSSTETGTDGKV